MSNLAMLDIRKAYATWLQQSRRLPARVRSLRAALDCSASATLTYMATEIMKVCMHQTVGERRDAENGLTSPGLTRN